METAARDNVGYFPLKVFTRPCELEVLRLVGLGHATRVIAGTLHRSVKTIETYRSRIRGKLGLRGSSSTERERERLSGGAVWC